MTAIALLSSINFAIAGISDAVSIEGGKMEKGKTAYKLIVYPWLVFTAILLANTLFEILIWPLDWTMAGLCSWTTLITAKKLAQSMYCPGQPKSTQKLWKQEVTILAILSISSSTLGYISAPHFNGLGIGQWVDSLLLY